MIARATQEGFPLLPARYHLKKIYYLTLDWKLMVVPVTMGATVQVGAPLFLFSLSKDSEFEVLAEGKFLVNEPVGQLSGLQTVVLNWDTTLGFNK